MITLNLKKKATFLLKPNKITKWVAVARKSLLTIAFCIIFRGAPHGDVFGQKTQICKIAKMFTKWVAVARKSHLTIAFCIIFRGAPHGDVDFSKKMLFWANFEKSIFSIFPQFFVDFWGVGESSIACVKYSASKVLVWKMCFRGQN